ncbi:MAG: hypothetical protein ABSD64_03620 [Terriglobales bacterium]
MIQRFFHSGTFRAPQFAAAALLLAYLLQCLWLVHAGALHEWIPDSGQASRICQGLDQWKGGAIAGTPSSLSLRPESVTTAPAARLGAQFRPSNGCDRDGYDRDRSPLYYLVAAAPLLAHPAAWLPDSLVPLVAAVPYLFFGVMLGASLWYVARRLYGNPGGYIALALYCFSPAMIVNVAGAQSLGEMGAVWGAFGTIFTAIAVAHTLYAPREVVLWNWRRILLLGLFLTLAAGNQFSLGVLAAVVLPLMLWVAPLRTRSVIAIWTAAIAVAAALLFASYSFSPASFWRGILHARWIDFEPAALRMSASYRYASHAIFVGSPPLMLALPVALIAYFGWKRPRYFGNTAPLSIAALLLVLALAAPNFPGQGYHLIALVFFFVFVSGVFADLLESRQRSLVAAALCGLLTASALWNLCQLARLR